MRKRKLVTKNSDQKQRAKGFFVFQTAKRNIRPEEYWLRREQSVRGAEKKVSELGQVTKTPSN